MTDESPDKGKGKATEESDATPALEAPRVDVVAPADDKESREANSSTKDVKDSDADDDEQEDDDGEDEEDEEDEDEEDDEPKLKYARLTPHLASVYRNGDMTSSFMVAGDKMVSLERPVHRLWFHRQTEVV